MNRRERFQSKGVGSFEMMNGGEIQEEVNFFDEVNQ
jgi:hypothetical protein